MAAGPLPAGVAQQSQFLLTHNWDPANLYAILSSSDEGAKDDLYRAAFAAGPAIIPKLQNALKDDRTAEFAAQELAFIGGPKALAILAGLVQDLRNLDLRRFYYGALGGSDNPRHTAILLEKIKTSDREPDRTVTRNAILALSISSDPNLVAKLDAAQKDVTDPVVQDDLETAATVIGLRAEYLATPAAKNARSSARQAIRTYFMPALEAGPDGGGQGDTASQAHINIKGDRITYSPDKTRALAAVDFETSQAVAPYWMVLEKQASGWRVASVWLGEEHKKAPPDAAAPSESE